MNTPFTMQRFDLFTSLPSTLSCIVLREWLNLKSVMVLDYAFCSRSHRSEFLGLLESEEYFIREKVIINADVLLNLNEFSILEKVGQKLRSVKLVYKRRWSSIEPAHDRIVTFCRNLTHVHISTADCGRLVLQNFLRNNPHVESLKLSDFSQDMATFAGCFRDIALPRLNTLVLKYFELEGEDIVRVIKAGKVARLNLSWSYFTESDLLQIVRACHELKALKVSNISVEPITEDVLSCCSHVEHLSLLGVDVTDAEILSVVQNLKGLQSLNIIDTPRLTDASLVHIYTNCAEKMNRLMLGSTVLGGLLFSADAINTLLERCTPLRTLHLRKRSTVTVPFTFNSAAVCNLTTLTIGGDIVTERNIAIIGTHGVNLQVLEVESKRAYEALFSIVSGCPNLRKICYDLRCEEDTSIPENFLRASRETIRPGLQVTVKSVPFHKSWKPTEPACFDF